MKKKRDKKQNIDQVIKKAESISNTVDIIMRNRLIIAFFLIVDGVTFILNPNATMPEMAKNIIILIILAAFSVFIANLAAKTKDVKTIVISAIIIAVGIVAYIFPDFIAAYMQLLLALFIIYTGLQNIARVLNLSWLSKFIYAIKKKYNKIFNRKTVDEKKKVQREKFKEVDNNINQGLEQQGEKLLTPLKNIVNKSSKFSILYVITNFATVVLGIILLIFPDISIGIWGIIFLYTGFSNLFIAIKAMDLVKKIKERKFKEIIFDADKGNSQKKSKKAK